MPTTAIQIDHLSKMYRLGVINNGAFFRDIQTWMTLLDVKKGASIGVATAIVCDVTIWEHDFIDTGSMEIKRDL